MGDDAEFTYNGWTAAGNGGPLEPWGIELEPGGSPVLPSDIRGISEGYPGVVGRLKVETNTSCTSGIIGHFAEDGILQTAGEAVFVTNDASVDIVTGLDENNEINPGLILQKGGSREFTIAIGGAGVSADKLYFVIPDGVVTIFKRIDPNNRVQIQSGVTGLDVSATYEFQASADKTGVVSISLKHPDPKNPTTAPALSDVVKVWVIEGSAKIEVQPPLTVVPIGGEVVVLRAFQNGAPVVCEWKVYDEGGATGIKVNGKGKDENYCTPSATATLTLPATEPKPSSAVNATKIYLRRNTTQEEPPDGGAESHDELMLSFTVIELTLEWNPSGSWDEGRGTWENEVNCSGNMLRRPSPGNTKRFKAKIKPDVFSTKIRFELASSKLTGSCGNSGDETGFDLKFEAAEGFGQPTNENQAIETAAAVNEITIAVTATDYAASGKIKARVGWVVAKDVSVLKDINENFIEDAWDVFFPPPAGGKTDWKDDSDNDPVGDGTRGDLFTRLEEYRGFMVKGTYITLNPSKKDLFVCDKTGHVITDGGGSIMSFILSSGVAVREVLDTETRTVDDTTRVINFNTRYLGRQRAVFVRNDEALSRYGENLGSPPSKNDYCKINLAWLTATVNLHSQMNIGDTTVLYKGTSDTIIPRESGAWVANGKVKIDNEVISYGTGFNPGCTLATIKTSAHVDIPADAAHTTLLVASRPPGDDYFKYVAIGSEIIECGTIFEREFTQQGGLGGNITADANVIPVEGEYYIPPSGGYIVAKIDNEWISYSGVDNHNLTGVSRGLFGSNAVAHNQGANILYPRQYSNCKRAQFGSALAVLLKNTSIVPLGVLTNCSPVTAQHAANAAIKIFSNPDDAVRDVTAHEVGHAMKMSDGKPKLMQATLSRGSYLGGGLYNEYHGDSKKEINCK